MKRNKIARIILATLLTATMFTACHKAETTTSSADSSSVDSSTSSEESSSTESDTSSIESSTEENSTSSESDTSSTATSSTVVSSTTPSQAPVSSAKPTPTPSVAPTKPVVTYTTKVVAPTCTEKGYTLHTGSDGTSYKDTWTNATGHKFGDWYVETPATTENEGVEARVCSVCGHKETRSIPKLPKPVESVSSTIPEPPTTSTPTVPTIVEPTVPIVEGGEPLGVEWRETYVASLKNEDGTISDRFFERIDLSNGTRYEICNYGSQKVFETKVTSYGILVSYTKPNGEHVNQKLVKPENSNVQSTNFFIDQNGEYKISYAYFGHVG